MNRTLSSAKQSDNEHNSISDTPHGSPRTSFGIFFTERVPRGFEKLKEAVSSTTSITDGSPRTPPPLVRYEDGTVWTGRKQFPVKIDGANVTIRHEGLNDIARIAWMIGYNAKTEDVQRDLTKALTGFDHYLNMLPPEVTAPPPITHWSELYVWIKVILAFPVGITAAVWLIMGAASFFGVKW